MYINLSKKEFVRTFLKYKKINRFEIRISRELVDAIKLISKLSATKFIRQAIIEKIYSDGGRIYGENKLDLKFTKQCSRPYTKCKSKNGCFYFKNY